MRRTIQCMENLPLRLHDRWSLSDFPHTIKDSILHWAVTSVIPQARNTALTTKNLRIELHSIRHSPTPTVGPLCQFDLDGGKSPELCRILVIDELELDLQIRSVSTCLLACGERMLESVQWRGAQVNVNSSMWNSTSAQTSTVYCARGFLLWLSRCANFDVD